MAASELEKMITETEELLGALADAVRITDMNGNMLYQNQTYERMLKRSSTELVADGRDIFISKKAVGKITVYHDISEVNRLRKELDRLSQKLRKAETKYSFKDIIGQNPALVRVVDTAKVAAMTPATILLRGESGTGKEVFANAIHNSSPRRNEKFIKINCSSLPEELLESELFGYKDGAFTGAKRGGRKGLFQEADKGTLFLDEIGDISPRMQVKLLRVLQEREVMPLGSSETVSVDVRIICATHKPLEDMVKRGEFREDLYYRLNVFPLFIPPLRERKEDIGAISAYLLNKHNEFYSRSVERITPHAVELLKRQDWPGNVRELENVLARAIIGLGTEETVLDEEDIAAALGETRSMQETETCAKKAQSELEDKELQDRSFQIPEKLAETVEAAERACILQALRTTGGDKNKAAVILDLPLRTLYYKCKKLGI